MQRLRKRLEESGVISTREMKKLSEKQKLIQDQSMVIVEKEKESKVILEAVENLKEKQRAHAEISKKA